MPKPATQVQPPTFAEALAAAGWHVAAAGGDAVRVRPPDGLAQPFVALLKLASASGVSVVGAREHHDVSGSSILVNLAPQPATTAP